MANLRVRFAPNSLEPIHICTARTAIINYLYAKKFGGEFVIRIADLNKGRSAADESEQILDDLRWLKLDWNEGPLSGGNFGPYKQSLRSKIYKEHINILIDKGLLYPCYCQADYCEDAQELNQLPQYDNRCRNLTEVEKLSFENQGIKPVWRLKVDNSNIVINDLIKGEVKVDISQIGDFVVIKPDGTPVTYFADTIDDHLMDISHIIKCGELLHTTAISVLVFDAFDYPVPEFAHLGLLKGTDNKPLTRIEQGGLSICNLREKGYLPEAIVNYLVNLCLPVDGDNEYFILKQLVERFGLNKITGENVVFDKTRLDAYGNHYIRDADIARITDLTMPYLKEYNLLAGNLNENEYQYLIDVVRVIRHNVSSLSEITRYAEIFLKDLLQVPDVIVNELQNLESQSVLLSVMELLDEIDCFDDQQAVDILLGQVIQKSSEVEEKVYKVLKWALTGSENELELTDVLRLLTKEKVKLRIRNILK